MRLLATENGRGKLKGKRIDAPVVRKGLLARISRPCGRETEESSPLPSQLLAVENSFNGQPGHVTNQKGSREIAATTEVIK
jgi:hypothetical protein